MQSRRRCARFMESSFKSKFTNTPNHPLVLDDDDFETPITEKHVVLSHTSSKKLRKSPILTQKYIHMKWHVNQHKKPDKHIRKKLKVTSGETSQATLVTSKNFKRNMKIYKAIKNPKLRNDTPRRFPRFHHRMSPSSMLQAIRCLTKYQKRLVNEMGLCALFHLKIDTLPGKLCEYVVRNYQPTTSAINVQNGQVSRSKLKIHDWCQYLMDCLESAKLRWRPDDQHIYYTGLMTDAASGSMNLAIVC